jgi:LPXTG-site transpeptidase (sortase) family protein
LGVDVLVALVTLDLDGYIITPDRFAGFWADSANLGTGSNTVIVGHNRPYPRDVFGQLSSLEVGNEIVLTDQFGEQYRFQVSEKVVLPVNGFDDNRAISYIRPTENARLTLITCHPDITCSERLIIVALPVS